MLVFVCGWCVHDELLNLYTLPLQEMRRERNHHARMSRISSVGDESDMQETK